MAARTKDGGAVSSGRYGESLFHGMRRIVITHARCALTYGRAAVPTEIVADARARRSRRSRETPIYTVLPTATHHTQHTRLSADSATRVSGLGRTTRRPGRYRPRGRRPCRRASARAGVGTSFTMLDGPCTKCTLSTRHRRRCQSCACRARTVVRATGKGIVEHTCRALHDIMARWSPRRTMQRAERRHRRRESETLSTRSQNIRRSNP